MKYINKYRNLEYRQKKIRLEIMDMIINKESTINLNEIRAELYNKMSIDLEYINDTLNLFIKENVMVVDEENNINFIYPVSAHPTMHKVTLQDGRRLNTMCAIDALGVGCTFSQDIEINSICNVTGKEIKISVKNNKIDYINNDNLRVLHINLEKYDNWAASCWNIMNFFWTKNEFVNWTIENGFNNDKDIYCLDINEAFEASKEIFDIIS